MSAGADGWQFLVRVAHLYRDMMRATVEQTGVSKTRLEILDVLADDGELSQAELQRRVGVEGPVITRIVKHLEAEGLVTRRRDPTDNRYTLVALNFDVKAKRNTAEMVKFKQAFGERIMRGINETERAVLLDVIKRVQENFRSYRPADQPDNEIVERITGSRPPLHKTRRRNRG
jgi:DNA-binding MarR family transcriptional regulator